MLVFSGRYYYWHTESDAVSWLSPRHPRAVISESAAHIREEMKMAEVDDDEEDEEDDEEGKDSDMDEDGEVCFYENRNVSSFAGLLTYYMVSQK